MSGVVRSDRRHKLTINHFNKAETEDALRALWNDAVRKGDIPGAYWATLTHPLTTQAIIREAFGEVHMLSHLTGSANRADIRRLSILEAEKTALEAKLERQQNVLHRAIVTRDQQVAELRQALAQRILTATLGSMTQDSAALHGLVTDLERRLAAESRRRATIEQRLATAQAEAERERAARTKAERDGDAACQELDAIEACLSCSAATPEAVYVTSDPRLEGVVVLYVGGRPNQIPAMRLAVERLGATLLHHDGGIENHANTLAGLTSRSDLVTFPVDCISHQAANLVKTMCRQGGKPFVPLRSSGVTSLLAALKSAYTPPATG